MNFDRCDALFAVVRGTGSITKKEAALRELFEYCEVLSFEFGRGSILYRARKCDDAKGYARDRDIFHPPLGMAAEGRLNEAGEPVLYLSTREETALTEISIQPGEFAHVAGFRILADKTLRIVAIGEVHHLVNTGRFRTIGNDPDLAAQRMLNKLPLSRARVWAYIDAFLADMLAQPDKAWYPVTRLIAKIAFEKSKGAQAIFYPSVRRHQGMNLAISAEMAERVHSVMSFVARVDSLRDYGFIEFERVRMVQEVDDDGRFVWLSKVEPARGILYRCTEAEFRQGLGADVDLLDLPAERSLPGEPSSLNLADAIRQGLGRNR